MILLCNDDDDVNDDDDDDRPGHPKEGRTLAEHPLCHRSLHVEPPPNHNQKYNNHNTLCQSCGHSYFKVSNFDDDFSVVFHQGCPKFCVKSPRI